MSDANDKDFRRHRDVGKSVEKHALCLLLISLCISDRACPEKTDILTNMPSFSILSNQFWEN